MKKIGIGVGLVIVVVAAIALTRGGGKEIPTVTPTYKEAVQAVYATGTVEPVQMIPIAPKISARLVTLEVDEGHTVTKGQALAQLEDEDIRQSLAEVEARFTLAEKNLARAQKLGKTGAISKEGLENAQAEYASAKASVERARAELTYVQLLAPDNGTIIRRDGEIGELATPQTPVFWMTGGNAMRVESEVDEEDISLVKPGQDVVISADAYPGQIFMGKVLSITPKGDPVARSYRVRVSLEDNSPLMIGMTAETNIITQTKDKAMMIPLSAVKKDVVWVKRGKNFEKVAVKTGIETDTDVEILEGIGEGDAVAQRFDDVAVDETQEKGAHCPMGPGGC